MSNARDFEAWTPAPVDASTRVLVKRIFNDYARHQAKVVGLALCCMLVTAGATIGFAKLVEPILDGVFEQKDESIILPLALALVAIGLVRGLGTFGQSVLMAKATNTMVITIQAQLFAHLMRADLAFFQNVPTGHIISRILNDMIVMRGALVRIFVSAGRDLFTALGLFGLMIYQDWRLALISMVGLPVTAIVVYHLGRRMRSLSREVQDNRARLTILLDEAFRGARHIKSYGMEQHETVRAVSTLNRFFDLSMIQEKTRSMVYPFIELVVGVGLALVIVYGGYQVIAGEQTTGSFVSFVAALLLCSGPIRGLTQFNVALQTGLAAAQRIFDLLDSEPTIVDKRGAVPLKLDRGEIHFENVGFSYVEDQAALNGVSLSVPAGKTVALVGPSGAGKSTILNLIPRFFEVSSGRVLIDGQDVRDVTLASLRGQIGLVSQEVSLFDDTVRANIAYGRTDATEEEIIAAARHVGAHDFIVALPDGYDTPVGGRGELLSGGQRQRIAIARAMLKNAPILLLDEATSSLDTTAERQIQSALGTLMRGRTTLIVAHRLSTIVHADLIYVIEDGLIIESGTHGELIGRGGVYAELQAAQSTGEPDVRAIAGTHA